MRFGAMGMKRPEDFPKRFNIYAQPVETNARGRVTRGAPQLKAEARCVLSVIRPEERERYHQMGVTATHTIFHAGAPVAGENDLFKLVKGGAETRVFRVTAVQDHGEMDIFTTYLCEERGDLA